MATHKAHNYSQMIMLPMSLGDQLLPETLEWAIHKLVEHRVDTAIIDAKDANDETGGTGLSVEDLDKDCVVCQYPRIGLIAADWAAQNVVSKSSRVVDCSLIMYFLRNRRDKP